MLVITFQKLTAKETKYIFRYDQKSAVISNLYTLIMKVMERKMLKILISIIDIDIFAYLQLNP